MDKIYTAGERGVGGGLLLSRALKFGLVATRIRIQNGKNMHCAMCMLKVKPQISVL